MVDKAVVPELDSFARLAAAIEAICAVEKAATCAVLNTPIWAEVRDLTAVLVKAAISAVSICAMAAVVRTAT